MLVKALSIRQPWAWLIMRPDLTTPTERNAAMLAGDLKDVENRTWWTHYRGPVLIHAGQTMTRDDYEACRIFLASDARLCHLNAVLPTPAELERGGIVGQANIVSCGYVFVSPWFVGDYGFELADAMPQPFRPLKGRLGLFNVEAESA